MHIRVAYRAQDDFAAFQIRLHRLNHAAVAQGAGKNADRIALERSQIDSLISGRLHLQGDAFQPPAGYFHALPRRQHHAAALRLDQRRFGDIDVRRNQHHIATPGDDVAIHHQSRAAATKPQPPSHRIGLRHAQCRCREPRCVHHRASTHGDTRLIHQHQLAVARQRAKKLRRRIGDDPVDRQTARIGLYKVSRVAAADGEAVPVDGRVVAIGSVSRGNGQAIGLAGINRRTAEVERSTTVHRNAARRQSLRMGRKCAKRHKD